MQETNKGGGAQPKVRDDDRRGSKPGERGQPAFQPTKEQRDMVMVLAKVLNVNMLAARLNISVKTLRKHFRHELNAGTAEMIEAVGSKVIQQAMKGDKPSQFFILKTRGGWETPSEEASREADEKVIDLSEIMTSDEFNEDELRLLIPLLRRVAERANARNSDESGGSDAGDFG